MTKLKYLMIFLCCSVIDSFLEFRFGKLRVLLMHSHFDIRNWSIRVNKFGNTCDLLSRILKLSLMVHFTLNQGLVTSAHNYSFSSGIHGFHVKLLVAGALYLLKGRFRERPLNIFSSLSLWDLRRQGCEHSVAISLHGINILIRELSVYLAVILFLSR